MQVWGEQALVPNEGSRLRVLSQNVTLGNFGYFWKHPSPLFFFFVIFGESCHKWLVTTSWWCRFIAPPYTYQLSTEALQNQPVSHAVAQYSHLFTLFGELFELLLLPCLKYIYLCSSAFLSQFGRWANRGNSNSFLCFLHYKCLLILIPSQAALLSVFSVCQTWWSPSVASSSIASDTWAALCARKPDDIVKYHRKCLVSEVVIYSLVFFPSFMLILGLFERN